MSSQCTDFEYTLKDRKVLQYHIKVLCLQTIHLNLVRISIEIVTKKISNPEYVTCVTNISSWIIKDQRRVVIIWKNLDLSLLNEKYTWTNNVHINYWLTWFYMFILKTSYNSRNQFVIWFETKLWISKEYIMFLLKI